MSPKPAHDRFNLYAEGNDAYTFEPIGSSAARSLTFKRSSGDIILNAPNTRVGQSPASATRAYGILGLISLSTSDYLIIITGRELKTRFMGHDIYQATDFKVLPLDTHAYEHPAEGHLLALVQTHLSSGLFWFSYTFDITRRLQAHWVSAQDDADKALWETADDRFFWNKFLQSRLIDITTSNRDQDLSPFILPVMYGTFDIKHTAINGKPFIFSLISRRSRYRAGTRYFRRGIDELGHVANFNETEQIVLYDAGEGQGKIQLSFVQIRGSIPLFWAEVNTLRYKPDLQIMNLPNSMDALRTHLRELVSIYGSQTLVNLVDQHGHEKPMKEAYDRAMAEAGVPEARYQYFDFHNECKHMRYDRINNLIQLLEEDLVRKGYFYNNTAEPQPRRIQIGTVRTNCMDNLDRTNVVQTHLAKWTLNRQLREVGIISNEDEVENHPEFMSVFRMLWSDHADTIAMAYAGSGAMKTDFTRTGKRSRKGALLDGYNSVTRYVKNNYFDGPRQDAFDLMTGAWTPRRGTSTAMALLVDRRSLLVRSMPYVLSFSLFMICAGLTLPRTSDYSLKYYFIFWILLFVASLSFIRAHGIEYVAWPRLNPPVDVIYYEGPGFRKHRNGMGFSIPWLNGKGASGVRLLQQGQGRLKALAAHKLEEIEMGTKTKKRVD
ncbi:inositol/phosphatidylinositol phosphatase [Auricularia subglabra TFB-10046 SS5]|nr:inositol/phosphatidylinositol phosphatase [Auricularia subglabra TFB-10046 SS5]